MSQGGEGCLFFFSFCLLALKNLKSFSKSEMFCLNINFREIETEFDCKRRMAILNN